MHTTGKDAEFGQAVRGALLAHTCPVSFWAIVERRDAEGMLPAVVGPGLLRLALPWWAKYVALTALVAAIWGHGWLRGAAGVREEWEAATAKAEAARAAQAGARPPPGGADRAGGLSRARGLAEWATNP